MLNIAIFGCGMIGEIHGECLAALGTPPVLFVDSDRTRAKVLAERYSARESTDPFEAIRSEQIDAIYICTYHDTHAPLAIEAARNGKHIFLEKPMALTEKACYDILAEVRLSDSICMTGFKLHYYSLARKAKSLIQNPIALSAHVLDNR
ncbi:MAG TPA: Gfo/Idh/MocA family oxidoreductase, partial [Candidatus Kapabacteria bacterium]